MQEVVGNLVVTDLRKFLEKPLRPLSSTTEALVDAVNELTKIIPYDFNRIRKSVVDAYEGISSYLIFYINYLFHFSCSIIKE
jgi:hypothetical protein